MGKLLDLSKKTAIVLCFAGIFLSGCTDKSSNNITSTSETVEKFDVGNGCKEDMETSPTLSDETIENTAVETENVDRWEKIYSYSYYAADKEMIVEVWLTWDTCEAKICCYPVNDLKDTKEVYIPWESYVVGEVSYFENETGEKFLVVDRITGAHETHFPLIYRENNGNWTESFGEKAKNYAYRLSIDEHLQCKIGIEDFVIEKDVTFWKKLYEDGGFTVDESNIPIAMDRDLLPTDSFALDKGELVLRNRVCVYTYWDQIATLECRYAYEDGQWILIDARDIGIEE